MKLFLFLELVSSQLNNKKEKTSTASARPNRKNATVIRCDGTQKETTSNKDPVHVRAEAIVTKMDTIDSLREKFPKASPYEFEFLVFLTGNQE